MCNFRFYYVDQLYTYICMHVHNESHADGDVHDVLVLMDTLFGASLTALRLIPSGLFRPTNKGFVPQTDVGH